MRYSANRNYLYPVLRPYSDDYASGELTIDVEVEPAEQDVVVRVKFDVSETSILNQIKDGNACCVAMLYCRETLHREMLRADKGQIAINAKVQGRMLVNDVELHPAIVAVHDITHSTHTAHAEYGGQDVQIGKFQPLATAPTWRFSVDTNQRATKSVFNLVTGENLSPDIFDVEVDPTDPYINIKANEDTLRRFNAIRRENEILTLPSVFMNALMEALACIDRLEDEDDVHSNGWVVCIKDNLNKHNISLDSHSLIHAAQILLSKPFGAMISLVANPEDISDDDSEDDIE